MQTHKVFNAINFVQRNRNWADGLLFSPLSWSKYEYSLFESLIVSDIITIEIVFSKKYSLIDNGLKSIFTEICKKTLTGDPDKVYLDGIKEIQKIIKT